MNAINVAGRRLRDAALQGPERLSEQLDEFVAQLRTKRFAGASADASAGRVSTALQRMSTFNRTISGARHAVAAATGHAAAPPFLGHLSGDAKIVAELMKELAHHLPAHWEREKAAQRQRALMLAVHRGDAATCACLCAAGADPNALDARGSACLHTAALRQDAPVCRALLEAGARTDLADGEGNLPAHNMPLWATAETVSLFTLLAPPPVLKTLNKAGVSPFDRWDAWSATAEAGERFEPAQALVDSWLVADPTLREDGVELGEESSEMSLSPNQAVSATVRSVEVGTDCCTPIREFTASDASIDILCFAYMSGLPYALFAPHVERFCRLAAARLRARVLLIQHAPRSTQSSLREFHNDLLAIIARLELSRGRFGVVDCTHGSVTPLLWELEPRLAFALAVNANGFWAEEYMDSLAHRGFAAFMAKYERMFSPPEGCEGQMWWLETFEAGFKLVSAVCCFARKQELDALLGQACEACRREADADALAAMYRHAACLMRWQVREYAAALRGRPRLQVPTTLLMSAFAPATVTIDSGRRIQLELLGPRSTLGYIPRSKSWVFSAPEQRTAIPVMLRALKSLREEAACPY